MSETKERVPYLADELGVEVEKGFASVGKADKDTHAAFMKIVDDLGLAATLALAMRSAVAQQRALGRDI